MQTCKVGDIVYTCEILKANHDPEVVKYTIFNTYTDKEGITIYVAKNNFAGFDFDQIDLAIGRVFITKKEAEEVIEEWRKRNDR